MKTELIDWMDARNVSPEALSVRLGVSKKTVYQWRASGVPERKREHLRRVMAQWDLHPDSQGQAFIVRPTAEQFREWNRAALKRGELIEDWALRSLDELAAEELGKAPPVSARPPLRAVAEDPGTYGGETLERFELPFLGAVAAGEPVEAPLAESVMVPRRFPSGHFVVEINGQSAEPEFPDGSRWVIDGRDKFTPKNGAVCVVSDGSGSYLKRWNRERQVFESINSDFDDVLPAAEAQLQGYPVERLIAQG